MYVCCSVPLFRAGSWRFQFPLFNVSPHTVQSDTTRCGVSRVGHAAKRPRLYRSDNDFTYADSNFSRLPLDNNNVAIVKKRKKLNKERKERFGGRVVLENDLTQK